MEPFLLNASDIFRQRRRGLTRPGQAQSWTCLQRLSEGGEKIGNSCKVVENAHDEQSEFNEDGGLCYCRGQR